MPALAYVDLAVDGVALTTTPGTSVGTSSALMAATPYLVLATGNGRDASANQGAAIDLAVGGSVCARNRNTSAFPAPAAVANGAPSQLGAAFVHTPAGAGELLEFRAWTEDAGTASSLRAYAIDLSTIPASGPTIRRWHSQTPPTSDSIPAGATPTAGSGWVDVYDTLAAADASGRLTFTAPRSGPYVVIASAEAVPSGAAVATDRIALRLVADGVPVPSTTVDRSVDADPAAESSGWLRFRLVNLDAGESYTFAIQANGTGTAGRVGFRRLAIHVLEAAAFDDAQQDTDGGETLTGPGEVSVEADMILITADPPAARDYLLLASGSKQASFWSEEHFLVDGVEQPVDGFSTGAGVLADLSTDPSGGLLGFHGLHVEAGIEAAATLEFRLTRFDFAGSNAYAGDAANPGGDELSLLAVALYAPDIVDGAVAFTGAGTLAAAGAVEATAFAALQGGSSLAAAPVMLAAVAFGGSAGTLGAAAVVEATAVATLASSSSFAAEGIVEGGPPTLPPGPLAVAHTGFASGGDYDFEAVIGDTVTPLEVTITVGDGAPLDLTSATSVVLRLRHRHTGIVVDVDVGLASIVDAAGGQLRRRWAVGEVAVPGPYDAQWRVSYPAALVLAPNPGDTDGTFLLYRFRAAIPAPE